MMARVYVGSLAVVFSIGCGVAPQVGLTSTPLPASSDSRLAAPLAATAVRCGASQLAVLTQEVVAGQVSTVVTCVEREAARVASPVRSGSAASPQDLPVHALNGTTAATASAPADAVPEVWETAHVRRTSSPSRQAARAVPVRSPSREPYEDEDIVRLRPRERSWQKRALVIGGTAGVGAGVGALAGGKKGALIGAAIGAGGATLYEARK